MEHKKDNIYIYLWEEFNTIYIGRTINPKSRHYQHREEFLAQRKKYREENREKILAYKKKYREKHREELRLKAKEYCEKLKNK